MANCSNITETEADARKRAKTFWPLISEVVEDLDAEKSDPARLNIKRFVLHVAWHEGARLTTRLQIGGGPGRSFLQMEPSKAIDSYDYAKENHWVGQLLRSSGATSQELQQARDALSLQPLWPANNRLEIELRGCDRFGLYLGRIALKRINAAIGMTNQDHALYWADHWKIKFASSADRVRQIGIFQAESDEVDALLPR